MGRMEGRPVKSSMSQLSYPAKPPSTRQSSPESAHLPGKPTLRQDLPGKVPRGSPGDLLRLGSRDPTSVAGVHRGGSHVLDPFCRVGQVLAMGDSSLEVPRGGARRGFAG
jgi:hypothetical protein